MRIKSAIFRLSKKAGLSNELISVNLFLKRLAGVKHKDFQPLYEFYGSFIKEGSLVFDIGANVGNRSEVFLALGAKVIAIEPNARLCKILKMRFRNEKFTVLNCGVGARNEVKEFYVSSNTLVSSFSKKFIGVKEEEGVDGTWKRKSEVEIRTLDSLISEYGLPDFCKIDVEGFEREVLSGLSTALNSLSFEFTSPEFNEEGIWCIHKLKEIGFTQFNISFKESLKFEFDKWVSVEAMIAYVSDNAKMKEKWYGDIYARRNG